MTAEASPSPKKYPRIWVFDVNRRVYRDDGRGGPIWRHHWVEREIVGETRVSWILEDRRKVPKKGHNPLCVAWSEDEIDRRAWVHDHCRSVCERLERLARADPSWLDAVAALIGYEPQMPRKP